MAFRARPLFNLIIIVSLLNACGGGGSGSSNDAEQENTRPTATINYSAPTNMEAPALITFDASNSDDSDGTIASYNWDFGDGNNSPQIKPSHRYINPGTYTVTLRVTDNEGAISAPASASLTVNAAPQINIPPSASFSYQANNGLTAPATLHFDASNSTDSDGTIISYNWSFGDGNSSSQAMPNHIYNSPGTYTVTLDVTDNEGAIATAAPVTITINNATSNYRAISLQSSITDVQPMTGIVLWESAWNNHALKNNTGNIQLEYAYVAYDTLISSENTYDWRSLDALLDRIAARQHQAIIRFYFTYPGRETTVPDYIKALPNYVETLGTSEGLATWFPDWSQGELETFHTNFYTAFAQRYDNDPRLAFLQVGFGLWAEYHIYDGPNTIGQQFPSQDYQSNFLNHLADAFDTLHWSVSIDAADSYYSPFSTNQTLRNLHFGNFDDSFMHEEHAGYNAASWQFFNHSERYTHSPQGGELSYYTEFDQRNALNTNGMYGRTYEQLSTQYNISYMIGNDQPNYQSSERIKEAGMANGYRFRITRFDASAAESIVTVINSGIAPIYYDAYITVNNIRATQSLKGLLPGEQNTYTIPTGGNSPSLRIESDRLVPGQVIQYDADLPGE